MRFTEWIQDAPYPKARISPIPAVFEPESQSESAIESLREAAESATRKLPEEVRTTVLEMSRQIDDPAILADVICQQFLHQPEERQQMLETESVAFDLTVAGGTLAPGLGVGVLGIEGDLAITAGALEVQIASPIEADSVTVSGARLGPPGNARQICELWPWCSQPVPPKSYSTGCHSP